MGRNGVYGFVKRIIFILLSVGLIGFIGFILSLPGDINEFSDEYLTLRERWLKAHQWTGMYSSFPEGMVNMEDLELSSDSDVVINLIYS